MMSGLAGLLGNVLGNKPILILSALNPVTNFRTISQRALGSISRTYYDTNNGKLYAAVRYPGQVAHIAAIDVNSGEINKICDVKGASLHSVSSLLAVNSTFNMGFMVLMLLLCLN